MTVLAISYQGTIFAIMNDMTNKETYRYNSTEVAKYIVASANERHISINITKVQKLLYIAYGVFLAIRECRLTNEHPQAWPYGPVFPTTRNKLLKVDLYAISKQDDDLHELQTDGDLNDLIELVFRSFGTWSAAQLTDWSHGENTPWQRVVSEEHFKWGNQIPDEYISSYFKSILRSNE